MLPHITFATARERLGHPLQNNTCHFIIQSATKQERLNFLTVLQAAIFSKEQCGGFSGIQWGGCRLQPKPNRPLPPRPFPSMLENYGGLQVTCQLKRLPREPVFELCDLLTMQTEVSFQAYENTLFLNYMWGWTQENIVMHIIFSFWLIFPRKPSTLPLLHLKWITKLRYWR